MTIHAKQRTHTYTHTQNVNNETECLFLFFCLYFRSILFCFDRANRICDWSMMIGHSAEIAKN